MTIMKPLRKIVCKIISSREESFHDNEEKCVETYYKPAMLLFLSAGLFLFLGNFCTINAQSTTQAPVEATLSGTLHMYLVTLYGDSLQEIDHYRKTHKEGECIAFVLKTDKPMDMTQYLSQEEIDFLSEDGTTWQSEFMVVPRWDLPESISEKDFASQYANKRVRVTGSLFCPMAGWMNVTLVRMDFTKLEVVE